VATTPRAAAAAALIGAIVGSQAEERPGYVDEIDVTDRRLWYEALSMAASEGVFGSFVSGDPYGTRDRMMAYLDQLRDREETGNGADRTGHG
jgi:hypothetical protein